MTDSDTSGSSITTSPQQRMSPSLEGAAAPSCEQNLDISGSKEAGPHKSEMAGTEGQTHAYMERLLEKQRSEIMFELRRLQLGDKPVTGQNNKEAVETFFQRAMGEGPPPPADEHRPEHVVVEVNALVERRPVSNVLQSAGFRRTLENALRSAIGSSTSTTANVSWRRPAPTRPTTRQVSTSNSSQNSVPAPPPPPTGDFPTTQAPPIVPTERPVNVAQILQADRQVNIASTAHHDEIRRVASRIHSNSRNGSLPPAAPIPPSAPAGRAASWVHQVQQQVNQRNGVDLNQWDEMQQAQREQFVQDISELVQRQLVTQTLESNFRHSLERRMQERMSSAGINGNLAQQTINELPRGTHMRNDFSDLGIGIPQALSDNLDEVSVISATAAVTVPYTQTNVAMSREMMSLKAQLQEMKNMMKLSFDLQMDIQRSIRQEVASALSQALAGGSMAPLPSRPVDDSNCTICMEKAADTVMYQCGHLCSCYSCALELRQRGANCPVCRAPIKDIIRTYRSS